MKYVDSVIQEIYDKDIKSNNKIRKKGLFQKVQTYIVNNFGATTSVNSICDYLSCHGENVSKVTVYNYACSKGYKISIGKIGKLEVDFILRKGMDEYSYVQVARTIDNDNYDENGKNITEEREYRPLESIADGYPKYLVTMDKLLQKRNGIKHLNIVDMMLNNEAF